MSSKKINNSTYISRFEEWDTNAWVRAKPHRKYKFDPNLKFYSSSLSVLLTHPDVQKCSQEVLDKLLVYHLYTYLDFTVWLELGPVNDVCKLISSANFLPWLPTDMKDDALRIYVDEGGHAEMAHTLKKDVRNFTKIEYIKIQPAFLHTLEMLIQDEEPEYTDMIKLFFVIISETLITGTLTQLPKDITVQQSIREFAADHASDEGKHHAYFKQVFEEVFASLPRETRIKMGRLIPNMILAFLSPDENMLLQILKAFPDEFPFPSMIVSDIISSTDVKMQIKASAAPTLKILQQNNVFSENQIADSFIEHELMIN